MQIWPVAPAARRPALSNPSAKMMLSTTCRPAPASPGRGAIPRSRDLRDRRDCGKADLVDARTLLTRANGRHPPRPVTTLMTPGGKPAFSTSLRISSVVTRACSDGLTATQLHLPPGSRRNGQRDRRIPGGDDRNDAVSLHCEIDDRLIQRNEAAIDLVGITCKKPKQARCRPCRPFASGRAWCCRWSITDRGSAFSSIRFASRLSSVARSAPVVWRLWSHRPALRQSPH